MQTVTVTRRICATKEAVCESILDIEPFTRAAGFDEVTVSGRTVEVSNSVGVATISLVLEVIDNPDAVLTIEQRDGIFESMRTVYDVEPDSRGVDVNAITEFAIDVAVIGGFLDATVIRRQRRKELNAQLDYLEAAVADRGTV